MKTKVLKKIDIFVVFYGILLCGGALFFFGSAAFAGTLTGAAVAIANWVGFRWAGIRFAATGNKVQFALFLVIKSSILIGIVVIILLATSVDPVPFVVGFSALVLGTLTGGAAVALEEGEKALKED